MVPFEPQVFSSLVPLKPQVFSSLVPPKPQVFSLLVPFKPQGFSSLVPFTPQVFLSLVPLSLLPFGYTLLSHCHLFRHFLVVGGALGAKWAARVSSQRRNSGLGSFF